MVMVIYLTQETYAFKGERQASIVRYPFRQKMRLGGK